MNKLICLNILAPLILASCSAPHSKLVTITNTAPSQTTKTNQPPDDKLNVPTPEATQLPTLQTSKAETVLVSPDGRWNAVSGFGKLTIKEINSGKEWEVECKTFLACEFLIPTQWLPDSKILFFAPLITGESATTLQLFTGIASIDITTGKINKFIEVNDKSDPPAFSFSVSMAGNYLAYSDNRNDQIFLVLVDAHTQHQLYRQAINETSQIGNILWAPSSDKLLFQTQNFPCSSSVYSFDITTKSTDKILQDDKECIELISWGEYIFLKKFTLSPTHVLENTSYWYFDLFTNQLVSAPTPHP